MRKTKSNAGKRLKVTKETVKDLPPKTKAGQVKGGYYGLSAGCATAGCGKGPVAYTVRGGGC